MATATLVQPKNPLREFQQFGGELILRGLTKEQFKQITTLFPDFRMEREKNGDITIMDMVHGANGRREDLLNRRVGNYCEQHLGGMTFSPSTGFDLPDGATKSPDVSWVSPEKIARISAEELENEYLPVAPDFVAELRSGSDSLKKLRDKMQDTWMGNGVRLGWLIDPYGEKAYVYRQDGSVEVVSGFDKKLSGEDVLPGFLLDLSELRKFGSQPLAQV